MTARTCTHLALCAAAATCIATAQSSATLTPKTSTDAQTPANLYAVDLNNDGFDDLVGDDGQSAPGFNVSINNGDGTFKAPVHYSVPAKSLIGTEPIVTGDFNGDGKADVVVVLSNTAQVAFFAGNGDGSLQAPKISTVGLPSGWIFQSGGATGADLNRDGKIDLIAWTLLPGQFSGEGVTALYAMEGDGAGGFRSPHLVLSGPMPEPDFQVYVGDFDADGKADLIATEYTLDSEGTNQNTHVHVLYGNGDFTFTDTVPYTQSHGPFMIGAGDLNSDGRSDFFSLNGFGTSQQLGVFYGTTSRTFASYFQSLSGSYPVGAGSDSTDQYTSQYILGDFNGDGRMDLAAVASNSTYSASYVLLLLATANAGQFTEQAVQMPAKYPEVSMPVVGLFGNSLLKPDVALNQSSNYGSPPQDQPSHFLSEINSTSSGWFGPCAYPRSGSGFRVCSPGTPLNGKTLFSTSVNSYGKLRKVELWVDGKKVQEQQHTWDQHAYFNWSGSFGAGTHQATFYAGDVDNHLQRYNFSFNVGGVSCTAPSSPGVHVCSPANNSTVSSPVQATASAAISGTLARMEIWVDGVKKYSETSSLTESASLSLSSGKHKFDFYAVNTAGTKWETSVYATVQ
ncbi:FG-GAP-like repeat-containing protein [Occallatibacter savannae]|uniref:FG-GAP-like repeat-containing protein n=1 Tax=Occallatibacter savannae TaxID=1002691 RepID=UPI000D686C0A|nr:FG-GAP-like repeat-containing protein [Occallatibacter savannae]